MADAYAGAREAAEPEEMGVEELQSAVHRLITDARGHIESDVGPDREKATKYYMGDPFGDEKEGRSKVVITELRDKVNAALPSLLRIFFSPERPVEYRPRKEEDVAGAAQATTFIGDIVVQEDNDGFLIFHSWFKDALVRKLGIVKYWWEDSETLAYELESMMQDQIEELAAEPGVGITSIEKSDVSGYRVKFTRREVEGYARFDCLPPEEVFWSKDARALRSSAIFGHVTEKTRSELIAMGYSEAILDEFGGSASSTKDNPENLARNPASGIPDEAADESTQLVLYIESYLRLDVDGDGIAELRKVCTIGDAYHVVHSEPVSRAPFALLCPDPEPHTILGLSYYDRLKDVQLIKSQIVRAGLNSMALSIFPQKAYVEGQVEQADVMSTSIGGPIRTKRSPAEVLMEFKHTFDGAPIFQFLEYFDQVGEDRVGISKASAGLNTDALQSTTKAAVAATVSAKQQQIELIARIFAETGVKQLFKGLLQLVCEHQPRQRIVRLRNQFVPMDPKSWNATMDVSVNVALGSGLVEERIAMLIQVAEKQELIIQTFGPVNPVCSLQQYRNTLARIVELSGFKDVTQFFGEVPDNWQPPQNSAPDPATMVAQAEMQKAAAHIQKLQADAAAQQQELQQKLASKQQELALHAQEMQMTDTRERDKTAMQFEMQRLEMELKYGTAIDLANIRADSEKLREHIKAEASVAAAHAPDPHVTHKQTSTEKRADGSSTTESSEVKHAQ